MDRDLPAPKSFDPAHSDAPPLPDLSPSGGLVLLVATVAEEDRDWAERSAAALATTWARQGRRILLADLGLIRPALHTILGVANDEGVTDTFLFGSSIQKVARPVQGGGFLFVPAGTVPGRPEAVTESPRWASVIEGCARVQATLVAYLPSDLPGRDTLLVHASDVVQLGGAGGSAALPAGLRDLVRAVLLPPGRAAAPLAAPEPDDAMGDFHFDEQRADEPPAHATAAPEAAAADDLFASLSSNSFGLAEPTETFSDSDLLFALPDAGEEEPVAAPASGGLAFMAPEPDPEPVHAGPPPRASLATAPLAVQSGSGEEFTRREEPASPRPAPRRPAPDERRPQPGANGKKEKSRAWQPVVLLLLALAVAAVALARLGVVEIPYLSDWLGTASADASPGSAPGSAPGPVVSAEPAAPQPVEGLANSLTLDAFTDPAVARIQAGSLNRSRPDLLFVVAPVQVDGTVYHRLLVGPAGDSASVAALRATLATVLTRENPSSWVLRPTPLAFLLGERDDFKQAQERVTELSRVDIPAYLVEVPPRTASGARRPPFRVYVGAYADDVEAAYYRNVLVAKGFPDSRLLERIGTRPE